MLYPHDIEQKLGFDKIRELLKNRCSGLTGKGNVDKIKFSSNPKLILKLCTQTEEFMKLLEAGEKVPALNYPEIGTILEKLKVLGVFLEAPEIADVLKVLILGIEYLVFVISMVQVVEQQVKDIITGTSGWTMYYSKTLTILLGFLEAQCIFFQMR